MLVPLDVYLPQDINGSTARDMARKYFKIDIARLMEVLYLSNRDTTISTLSSNFTRLFTMSTSYKNMSWS